MSENISIVEAMNSPYATIKRWLLSMYVLTMNIS